MSQMLAMLGGPPVRTEPFPPVPYIDEAEEELVLQVLRSRALSCFVGSPSPDAEELLVMDSATAIEADLPDFNFLGGRMVRRLEASFAERFDVRYAIAVNSATSGLSLALTACGAGPGDEVIVPCMSFCATGTSVLAFNSVPRFVDISPDNYCLDPTAVERAITPATRAILAVHLFGYTADMDAIMEIAARHGLAVVEDSAQAIGARYRGQWVGTIGDAGVFSFNHPKNISTGEGGMIVTDNPDLARHARLTRNHGESVPTQDYDTEQLSNVVGFNMRLTELVAAVGVAQMDKLDENNRVRNENAAYLDRHLGQLPFLTSRAAPDFVERVVHICAYEFDQDTAGVPRESVVQALRAEGIPVGTGYPQLMHEQPLFTRAIAYGRAGCPFTCNGRTPPPYGRGICPVAEELHHGRLITIPQIHRGCTTDDMDDIIRAFTKVLNSLDNLRPVQEDQPVLEHSGQWGIGRWSPHFAMT